MSATDTVLGNRWRHASDGSRYKIILEKTEDDNYLVQIARQVERGDDYYLVVGEFWTMTNDNILYDKARYPSIRAAFQVGIRLLQEALDNGWHTDKQATPHSWYRFPVGRIAIVTP